MIYLSIFVAAAVVVVVVVLLQRFTKVEDNVSKRAKVEKKPLTLEKDREDQNII